MLGIVLQNVSDVTGIIGSIPTCATDPIKCFQGNWGMLIGAVILVVAAFAVLYLLKQVVANAVLGLVVLLVIIYVLGVPIPLSPLIILISVLGGLGGVGAVLIATFFGWL